MQKKEAANVIRRTRSELLGHSCPMLVERAELVRLWALRA
jgi:hypothetical protein